MGMGMAGGGTRVGGGGGVGAGMGGGGGMGGSGRGHGVGGGGFSDDSDEGPRGGARGGQPGGGGFSPIRQVLRVKFTNRGKDPLEITIVEVNSLLGNFAPRPERLALAPGQSGSLSEMRASLGENLEELEVNLTLRRGQDRESKVVVLAKRSDASSAPSTPPVAVPPPAVSTGT